MEHESDSHTVVIGALGMELKSLGKIVTRNQRKNRDHPDYSNTEIFWKLGVTLFKPTVTTGVNNQGMNTTVSTTITATRINSENCLFYQ